MYKKMLYLASLLLIFTASSIFAQNITVTQTVIPATGMTGSGTVKVRYYANERRVQTDGTIILQGRQTAPLRWYKEVNATLSGGNVTIPQHTVHSTDDSNVPSATYDIILYDTRGNRYEILADNWRVPSSLGTTVDFYELLVANASPARPMPDGYYTKEEANILFLRKMGLLTSTSSILISGNGTVGQPYQPSLILSPDADNAAEMRGNGLYVSLNSGGLSQATIDALALKMTTSVFDSNADGKVDTSALADNSTLFGGQNAAYYLNRGNQTGTQAASTISDFSSSVDARITTLLGNVDNTSDIDKPLSAAVSTALGLKANTSDVVLLAGSQTISGAKTFSSDVVVPTETYGSSWNGSNEVPTKDSLYDKIETLGGGGGGASVFTHTVTNLTELTSALTAISTNPATIYVSGNVGITSNTTIPTNVRTEFINEGYFTISSGQILTVEGNLEAPPSAHIFRGSGTVRFTKHYPDKFHPEWWGAVVSDGADDSPAIQKALDSQRYSEVVTGSGEPEIHRAGVLHLDCGIYNISSTILVNQIVDFAGTGSCTQILAAANTTGIRVNGQLTEDSGAQAVGEVRTGAGAKFSNFQLHGQKGAGSHTVTVSGLTVTGTGFDARDGYQDGYTVTIGDTTYVIGAFVNSTTLTLNPFKLRLTKTAPSTFYSNYTTVDPKWVGATVVINNESRTISAVDTVANTITTSTDITAGSVDGESKITALSAAQFTGVSARFNRFAGIDARVKIYAENVTVKNFAGHGFQMDSYRSPSVDYGTEPAQNFSHFTHINAFQNEGAGFYAREVNANAMEINVLNSQSNTLGVFDAAQHANLYTSYHGLFNKQGERVGFGSVVLQGATFIKPYFEGTYTRPAFSGKVTVYGGTFEGFDTEGSPQVCYSNGSGLVCRAYDVEKETASPIMQALGSSATSKMRMGSNYDKNYLWAFGDSLDAAAAGNDGFSWFLIPFRYAGRSYTVFKYGDQNSITAAQRVFTLTSPTYDGGTPNINFDNGLTSDGDVYVQNNARGMILKSPDGTCYRFTVANGGALNTGAAVTCP